MNVTQVPVFCSVLPSLPFPFLLPGGVVWLLQCLLPCDSGLVLSALLHSLMLFQRLATSGGLVKIARPVPSVTHAFPGWLAYRYLEK